MATALRRVTTAAAAAVQRVTPLKEREKEYVRVGVKTSRNDVRYTARVSLRSPRFSVPFHVRRFPFTTAHPRVFVHTTTTIIIIIGRRRCIVLICNLLRFFLRPFYKHDPCPPPSTSSPGPPRRV